MKIAGQIVDIPARRIFQGEITLLNGIIAGIEEKPVQAKGYIMPGFIDAHVHIESSMLTPVEFGRLAVCHGTVATISDPHEIANVLGMEGVNYMIENGKKSPFKFNFGAPSCVPATAFETAGAVMGPDDMRKLLKNPEVLYLAEMMNFPGVIYEDSEVMEKIRIAHELGKPVDGHAPGLRGEDAKKYAAAGITTDHECFTYDEGLEKLGLGMKILIREGSAAKNFEALIPLLGTHPMEIMFCSDDKHPDDLIVGHINQLAARAVAKGHNVFDVLQAACLNPIEHYEMHVGQLRIGDFADFIIVEDLETFAVQQTWIDGMLVAESGESFLQSRETSLPNQFNIGHQKTEDFQLEATSDQIRVIEALDGELITNELIKKAKIENGFVIPDPDRDILKLTVVNRYHEAPPAVAFIKGFGFKSGAIASCVGHDSHNLIAVGTDDEQICRAVNLVIQSKGGIAAVQGKTEMVLPLPIAGIMSPNDGHQVGKAYAEIDAFTKEMGSQLKAPFMTLSFMGLLVIPALKLSDKGLFDGNKFEFVDVCVS